MSLPSIRRRENSEVRTKKMKAMVRRIPHVVM
jgi:hypothetical protein